MFNFYISEINMYHLGSQQKTDGTLKLVNSKEVYLHRYRRIMRHCSNPRWVAAERKAWLPKLQPNKSPQLNWRVLQRRLPWIHCQGLTTWQCWHNQPKVIPCREGVNTPHQFPPLQLGLPLAKPDGKGSHGSHTGLPPGAETRVKKWRVDLEKQTEDNWHK